MAEYVTEGSPADREVNQRIDEISARTEQAMRLLQEWPAKLEQEERKL